MTLVRNATLLVEHDGHRRRGGLRPRAEAVAVHLEAMNHCPMTRAELLAAVPTVHVPDHGETLEL